MSDPRPIGVFDSGVGGLTVLRAVRDRLPNESTVYAGDLAYFPYGPKHRSEVRDRAVAMFRLLVDEGVKAVVVACNTATSAALNDMQGMTSLPVIGVIEPGAASALAVSRSGSIGVVATEGTCRSKAYVAAIHRSSPDASVHQVACGELVALIEAGALCAPQTNHVVARVTEELLGRYGCDTIILGCTHFPLVKEAFQSAAGPGIAIVDSATSTAQTLATVLSETFGPASGNGLDFHRFLVTGQARGFVDQARALFGEEIAATRVEIGPAGSRPAAAAMKR